MKVIITADWHLSSYSSDRINMDSGLPDRLSSIKSVMYSMAEYAIDNGIDMFIIAGDLTHGKSIIYTIAQSILLDFFRSFKQLRFVVIDGNHDVSEKGINQVSALKAIDSESNVHRVKSVERIDQFLFIPHSITLIDDVKSNSSKYLVSHFGLNEGVVNSGISIKSDIRLSDLRGYDNVLLGHYHVPQSIIGNDTSIYYTGSIIELDWGERQQDKRFLVLDTDKNEIISINTEGYSKHFVLDITSDNRDEMIEKGRTLRDQGHFIRLNKYDKEVILDDIRDEFVIIDKTKDTDVTNRGISIDMNIEDKLKKYLQIKDIGEEDIHKYMGIGKDIVQVCFEKELI